MSQEHNDPWKLVIAGDYEQAIAAYTKQIEDDPQRASNLVNRGTIYLLMGEPARALDDFQVSLTVHDSRYWTSGQFARQGVCYWYLSEPEKAVEVWRKAVDSPYTDIAGGVEPPILLLYAGERLARQELRREAMSLLQRHVRRNLNTWPGQAVPFLLEKTDLADLEQALAAVSVPALRERYRCQLDFVVGLRALRSNDTEQFKTQMRRCAQNKRGILEEEYYLARWEVEHHFPDPAF